MTKIHSSLAELRSPRRGVVLLVILGLLAVLALLGIAFTTLSGSEEDAARHYHNGFANQRPELPPQLILEYAIGQIVADTSNPQSVFGGHSILRDMYGPDSDVEDFFGNPAPNGQIDPGERYKRFFNGSGDRGPDGIIGTQDDADVNFVFNGRRFTMEQSGGFDEDYDGADHQNMFMGAIGWSVSGSTWTPVVLAPSFHRPGLTNPATWNYVPPGGGPAQNWTTVDDWGDNYTEGVQFKLFSALATGYPAARGRRLILRPRPIDHLSQRDRLRLASNTMPLDAFGVDQAPGRVMTGTDLNGDGFDDGDDDLDGIVDFDSITGLPDLGELGYPGSDDIGLMRPAVGGYDVDNDGDGIVDSVWLDAGFPVQRTLDGRKFKPMVAVLCIDMDGKINLNAHGNLSMDKINASGAWVFPGVVGDGVPDSHADLGLAAHHGVSGMVVPLGSGASPSEINLQNIFSPNFFGSFYGAGSIYSPREYQWLLEGRWCGRTLVPGRYGEESLLTSTTPPRPGITGRDNDWPKTPYTNAASFGDRFEAARFGTLGPDGKAGRAGVDDDGDGTADFDAMGNPDPEEIGWSGSDDGMYRRPADFDGDGASWLDTFGRHRFGPWSVRFLGGGGKSSGWPDQWGEIILVGLDGQPGVASVDDNGNGVVDDDWELGWPGSDDVGRPENFNEADELNLYAPFGSDRLFTVRDLEALYRFHDLFGTTLASGLAGPDGQPGIAGVNDDSDPMPLIDDDREFGWPGSDDAILVGPDGAPGRATVDDDGNGVTDDVTELGWPSSDDVANTRLGALVPSLFDRFVDPTSSARRRRMLTTESWDVAGFSMFPLLLSETRLRPPPPAMWPVDPQTLPAFPGKGNGQFNYSGLTAKSPGGVGTPVPQSMSEPPGRPAPLAPGLVWLPGPDGHPGTATGNPPGTAPWFGNDDQDGGPAPGLQNERDELGWDLSDDYWLPAFLAAGRRLDLNRPNVNLPIAPPGGPPYFSLAPVTELNDPRVLARDIYVLLRQLRPTTDLAAIQRMAQFAVNVVDFRDPDDIMTGFEFDYDLTNGWNVDGDLSTTTETPGMLATERGVVWGVEAPRVVINETFAYETTADGVQFWIELYNPSLPSADDPNGTADLAAMDSANNRQPVYQLVLAGRNPPDLVTATGEPDEILGRKFTFEPPPMGASSAVTTIPGGGYLLVGPGSVPAGPMAPTVDFDTLLQPFGPNTIADIPAGTNWRVYLRRLADPGHPYNPGPDTINGTTDDLNPYITVDALDVQVFPQTAVMAMPPAHLSIERVEAFSVRNDIHTSGSADPHSLKAQNEKVQLPFTPLTFNDRPFVSPMELLLVPGVRPQWLTTAFVRPAADVNPFNPGAQEQIAPLADCFKTGEARLASAPLVKFDAVPDYYYGHLLNFFREDTMGAPTVPTPGYHRLLEFVEVPSRTNGSRNAFLNPGVTDSRLDRVPAKININTIYEPEILLALLNNHPAALVDSSGAAISSANQSAIWTWLKASRDGLDGVTGSVDDRPFRSFTVGATTDVPDNTGNSGFWPPGIQGTLLRGTAVPLHPDVTGSAPTAKSPDRPMLQDDRALSPPGITLTTPSMRGFTYHQTNPLSRVENLVTTRSNVYAVWITVGFFEVLSETPGQPPRLGTEVGIPTNEQVRHRGFYIIDRSRARGYLGPPRGPSDLKDIMNEVVIYSRVLE